MSKHLGRTFGLCGVASVAEIGQQASRGRPRLDADAKGRAMRLREARERAGLTARQVAEAIGVNKERYQYLEVQCSHKSWSKYGRALSAILNLDSKEEGHAVRDRHPACAALAALQPLSEEDLSTLGKRAAQIRKSRALTITFASDRIGVSPATLRQWERCFPQSLAPQRLQAWADLLGVDTLCLCSARTTIAKPAATVVRSPDRATVKEQLLDIAAWLAQPNKRLRIADYTRANPSIQRNAQIFAARYGAAGACRTLEAIGSQAGLTRERVRQICAKILERSAGTTIQMPLLTELKARVDALLPAPLAEIEETLAPILGEGMSLVGLGDFAVEVLGEKLFESLQNITGHQLLRSGTVLVAAGFDVSGYPDLSVFSAQ